MQIDWTKVKRVLVVRLRSIGDTVLVTPSLIALRRFLPEARIDVLLEDWVAPILEGFHAVDNVITVSRKSKKSRFAAALKIRRNKYDVAFNLHGGTTATFFVRASGAKYRVGLKSYQYNFLYTHLAPSPLDFWQTEHTHSAEQQLAVLGFAGVPVSDKPKSRLVVTEHALKSLKEKFNAQAQSREDNFLPEINFASSEIRNPKSEIALIHPTAAFDTKQWATENFARAAEFLSDKGLSMIAVATRKEREILETLQRVSRVPIRIFDNLTLPEITALAAQSRIFIGNDSGIAHIAAAVQTPSVVIFGSSNVNHWQPWTDARYEIVFEKMDCQPCAGYVCGKFDKAECIRRVTVKQVVKAAERLLDETAGQN